MKPDDVWLQEARRCYWHSRRARTEGDLFQWERRLWVNLFNWAYWQ